MTTRKGMDEVIRLKFCPGGSKRREKKGDGDHFSSLDGSASKSEIGVVYKNPGENSFYVDIKMVEDIKITITPIDELTSPNCNCEPRSIKNNNKKKSLRGFILELISYL